MRFIKKIGMHLLLEQKSFSWTVHLLNHKYDPLTVKSLANVARLFTWKEQWLDLPPKPSSLGIQAEELGKLFICDDVIFRIFF